MAETLRVEKKRTGGPVSVFIREHAVENEDLLSVRMIVRRKGGPWFVADDGSYLARFRCAHQVDALAPDRSARTRRPLHSTCIDHDTNGKVSIDRLRHGVLVRSRRDDGYQPPENSMTPDCRLYIAPAILIAPLDSIPARTGLSFRMLAIVSSTFLRATASTNA